MDVEKTVDEAINDLADILYGKEGATVNLSPVFNEYENHEEVRGIRCEIQRIREVNDGCMKAVADILLMYLKYGIVAESDEKLRKSESTLLTLSRILSDYERYLKNTRTDLEEEKRRYALIFNDLEEVIF